MFVSIRSFDFSEQILDAIVEHIGSMVQYGKTEDLR
jgi:hypothetical protein